MAASLNKSTEFKNVVVTTAIAAAHVLILVLSTDLGAALIYFIVYLVMLYVATRQPLYAIAGVAAGCGAAVVGYHLFSHIKVRVAAWQDPFAAYSEGDIRSPSRCLRLEVAAGLEQDYSVVSRIRFQWQRRI